MNGKTTVQSIYNKNVKNSSIECVINTSWSDDTNVACNQLSIFQM